MRSSFQIIETGALIVHETREDSLFIFIRSQFLSYESDNYYKPNTNYIGLNRSMYYKKNWHTNSWFTKYPIELKSIYEIRTA